MQCFQGYEDFKSLTRCVFPRYFYEPVLINYEVIAGLLKLAHFVFVLMIGRRKELFYLRCTQHIFVLRLYGFGHMVKDFSDSKRGTLLPPLHVLLFSISTK